MELHVPKSYVILDIAPREWVSGHLVSPKGYIGWVKGFQGFNSKTGPSRGSGYYPRAQLKINVIFPTAHACSIYVERYHIVICRAYEGLAL